MGVRLVWEFALIIWSGGSIGIPPVGGSRTGVTIMVHFFSWSMLRRSSGLSARNVISAEN